MLIVLAEVRVADGDVDAVRDALRDMEQATRHEPGCIGYAFSVDVVDATMLRITERWESADALRAHFTMPHMAAFGKAVAAVRPASMQVKCYEVARELPLPR